MKHPLLTDQLTPSQLNDLMGQAQKATSLLKSLSHETRLMILCILCESEKSVSEIETIIKLPQASVSQQLARLRSDKLVSTRREGRTIYYRLANDEVTPIVDTLYEMFCKSTMAKNKTI